MENEKQSKVFERLNIEIWNLEVGASNPEVQQAIEKVNILFSSYRLAFELELEHAREQAKNEILIKMLGETYKKKNFSDEEIKLRKLLKTNILYIDVPVRIHNALRCNGVMILGDLVSRSKDDLKTFRNLGSKSVEVLDDLLCKYNLKWSMNVGYLLLNEH